MQTGNENISKMCSKCRSAVYEWWHWHCKKLAWSPHWGIELLFTELGERG
jgi:hypothetical protein